MSYGNLTAIALAENNGAMAVSEIYAWFRTNYACFRKGNGLVWKAVHAICIS